MEIYLLSSPLKDYGGSGHLFLGLQPGGLPRPPKADVSPLATVSLPLFHLEKAELVSVALTVPRPKTGRVPQTLIGAPGFLLPGLSSPLFWAGYPSFF